MELLTHLSCVLALTPPTHSEVDYDLVGTSLFSQIKSTMHYAMPDIRGGMVRNFNQIFEDLIGRCVTTELELFGCVARKVWFRRNAVIHGMGGGI